MHNQPLRFWIAIFFLLFPAFHNLKADENADILKLENQVAWCIVPFDAAKRGPAERALMLKELGIQRCAYDWREEHVPTFEQEILEYQKQGIEFFAFWSVHEAAFKLFEKYDLHPQIWQILAEPPGTTHADKVEAAAQQWLDLAKRTRAMGCKLGVYNHGGWGGEPENMVAVCQRLHELGQDHVGIVYNFHHGHGHIASWDQSFAAMLPYLLCLNLNGMNPNEQPKILGIGHGAHELSMIRTVVASGYDGPIGILDHREQLDARESLIENRDGLEWIRKELTAPGSGGPKPSPAQQPSRKVGQLPNPTQRHIAAGHLLPGSPLYRQAPLTVEVSARLLGRDNFNILVASDTKQSGNHWELFSMAGSGTLSAYLPGMQPDHVHSETRICDGQLHHVAMIYEPTRVQLFVNGKSVADQKITRRAGASGVPGGFAIGRLVEGDLGCNGEIAWVKLSQGVRELNANTLLVPERDASTIGLWEFKPDPTAPGTDVDAKSITLNNNPDAISAEPPYEPELVQKLVSNAQMQGDAVRGASVFASDKLACISCHQVGQQGGNVGPALTKLLKKREPSHLVESLLWPNREVQAEYVTWQVLTTDGEVISGYKVAESDDELSLREPSSGKTITLARDDIDQLRGGGSVMPTGLFAAINPQQQLDLIRFLGELGRVSIERDAELEQVVAHAQMRGPAEFPITTAPVAPERWSNARHVVTRDRLYDFYTKQAEHYRGFHPMPMLLAPFPGLDGGDQGHWGNQNEEVWADDRWNQTELGSMLAGVFHGDGQVVARGVCVKLGEHGELSTCFDPDTLTYPQVWSGGFVQFDSVRHGFVSGLRMAGRSVPTPEQPAPPNSFQYRGFYRHGQRVIFSYMVDGVEYLDAPWCHNGEFVREVAPAATHSLRELIAGGPKQWPQSIETKITPGHLRPYAIDTIELPYENPWKVPVFCGDHDFFADGSALVCTMQGDVWHVTGLDAPADQTGVARWRRFASGLHHPLGIVIDDGEVYVQCRDQLTRLRDLNGDGEADWYECFSNAFETSPAGHDYICGLQRDAHGNFYTASGNQGLLRISTDGKLAEVLATGFRNPDGLGLLPDGSITVPVSEGEWTPASAINLVPNASHRGADRVLHYGYRGPQNGMPPELPLAYLPRGLDNSSGGQVQVNSDHFGALAGQLLHFSFGAGTWFAVLRDEVDGQSQGGIVPLAGDFLSGAHRGKFNPFDGQLYVSGMAGWGSYTPDDGCFQRVRYTGDAVQLPVGFHVHENGIRIRFAEPIDPLIAADIKNHFAQCWNYRYSGAYGSVEYSTLHPGVAAHDPLSIAAAHVLDDDRSLFLEIPEIQPVNQLHLRLHVDREPAFSCSPVGTGHDLFLTVHRLDKPFTAYDGYQPRNKTIAAHPLLVDLATNAVRVVNPWTKPIDGARPLAIETGKNLTYAQPEVTVRAGETIALTLLNPDVIPHNWVLAKPGSLQSVGGLANRLIAQADAYARQYIPESDDVLVHTDVIEPGSEQTIYFHAPDQPGRYPFLCTFPGHWMVMNGVMIVK